MRVILILVISVLCWGGLTFNFVKDGNLWAAFFASLPFIAFLFSFFKPTRKLSFFVLSHQFNVIEKEGMTERRVHFKMAKLWFLCSMVLPISFMLSFIFQKNEGFVIGCMFIGILLGIPCFLKAVGSLYSAIRANS